MTTADEEDDEADAEEADDWDDCEDAAEDELFVAETAGTAARWPAVGAVVVVDEVGCFVVFCV